MRMLSHVASVARGSVGGLTYTANQHHAIVCRARVSPVNPKTQRQSQMRAAFGDAQSLYEALSNADKQAWQDYAETLTFEGALGNYNVTGRSVCLGNLATALYLDDRGFNVGTPAATPPTAPGFLSIADLEVDVPAAVGTGFNISFRNNNAEDVTYYVQRSIAFNTGRRRFKGPWLTETLQQSDLVSGASANIDFLGLNDGSVYFAIVRGISDDAPYRMSRPFIVRAVASETVV